MSHLVKDSSGAYVQWKHFLGMGSTEEVRESIKASWLRCREFGLDPANRKSVGAIPKVRDGQSNGQETLRQLLVTRLQDMESHFKFDRFVVLFASPSGRILSLYGNERIIETFENLDVCESVNLSEGFSGTNAPAVCLVEQKSTTVLGAEHYFKDFHWAECAAAPVLDYQRRFLGCLGVTTTSESRIVLESLVEYFCWFVTTMTMEFFVEEKLQKLEIQDSFFRSRNSRLQSGDGAAARRAQAGLRF